MNGGQLRWTDPTGQLVRLREAVKILAEGRGKTADRVERATGAILTMFPEAFPPRLRNRATKVRTLRANAALAGGAHFRFNELKPSERARFVGDLIALYEACLIDIGRMWPEHDFIYPEDIAPVEESGP
jgi:hypothetical protein